MGAGARHVALEIILGIRPVQSAAVDIVSSIGLIQRYNDGSPWAAAGEGSV